MERAEMIAISQSVGKDGSNLANDVVHVQIMLNADMPIPMAPLDTDGKSGGRTIAAIEEFQTRRRILPGFGLLLTFPSFGRVGPATATMLQLAALVNQGAPTNLTAKFEATRLQGKTRQMKTGRITVNNKTYYFTNGGHGRGNLPTGSYTVTPHRASRSGSAYSFDGVGYSYAMSDVADARVGGADRDDLRIHPDGNSAGTQGCIGILGNADTLTAFQTDMDAELARSADSVTLTIAE
jgi:hypothetical protein